MSEVLDVAAAESAVVNRERWLNDARAALEGGQAKVAKLQEHVAAAEAQVPILKATVDDAEDALEAARAVLDEAKAAAETKAQAGVAEGSGN